MKKLMLLASCVMLSDVCMGCEQPEVQMRYVKTVGLSALPYGYYQGGNSIAHGFYTINDNRSNDIYDCPVPSPKKKTPPVKDCDFDDDILPFADFSLDGQDCPVPSPKTPPVKK